MQEQSQGRELTDWMGAGRGSEVAAGRHHTGRTPPHGILGWQRKVAGDGAQGPKPESQRGRKNLREIHGMVVSAPEYSLEGLMLKLKLQDFAT